MGVDDLKTVTSGHLAYNTTTGHLVWECNELDCADFHCDSCTLPLYFIVVGTNADASWQIPAQVDCLFDVSVGGGHFGLQRVGDPNDGLWEAFWDDSGVSPTRHIRWRLTSTNCCPPLGAYVLFSDSGFGSGNSPTVTISLTP